MRSLARRLGGLPRAIRAATRGRARPGELAGGHSEAAIPSRDMRDRGAAGASWRQDGPPYGMGTVPR
jgi:hypothetical protein